MSHNVFDSATKHTHERPGVDGTPPGKSPLITMAQVEIMIYVCSFMVFPICFFGIFANIINMIIFLKQGFKNTVNITLFAMAVSDLGVDITLLWIFVLFVIRNSNIPFVAEDMNYATGAVPHIFCCRVTNWFMALVTIERCLSVTIPLRIKRVVTPRRTVIALVCIFILNVLSFLPGYLEVKMEWKFFEERNKTLLSLIKNDNMGYVSFILTPALGIIPLALVTVATVVLVIQLKRKSKWRESVTRIEQQCRPISTRDKNTIKIAIVLASILIACSVPGVITTPVTLLEPEFSVDGAYLRLFHGIWAYNTMFQGFNSSVNIFFYYRMSSNYRAAFRQLFPACKKGT